jgi:hypothetical protein
VILRLQIREFTVVFLLLAAGAVGCHKGEQTVVGVAKNAVKAEHQAQVNAQAAATELDRQRAQMERIQLPTKSMYVNVRDAGAWANPFLTVDTTSLTLRIVVADANSGANGQAVGRRQEIHLQLDGLAQALITLPAGAWRYGRVIAVAESSQAKSQDRPKIRRNVEAAIKKLNDLSIVVNEWPVR